MVVSKSKCLLGATCVIAMILMNSSTFAHSAEGGGLKGDHHHDHHDHNHDHDHHDHHHSHDHNHDHNHGDHSNQEPVAKEGAVHRHKHSNTEHKHEHDHHDHNHDHDHHGHDHHDHDHHHGEGEKKGEGCPFAKMFKNKEGDSNGQAFDNFHKQFGFVNEEPRTLKEETNPHKIFVQRIMTFTKAESLMNVLNNAIKPLPDTVQALASTLFISIVPIFFIYLLNLIFLSNPSLRDTLIYYLISFAVGGLLGDVFFHTLPHLGQSSGSGHSHSHDHHHGHDHGSAEGGGHSHDPAQMAIYGIVIAGIISFFLIEKIVKNYLGGGDHNHSHGHGHSHSHEEKKEVKGSTKKGEKKGA